MCFVSDWSISGFQLHVNWYKVETLIWDMEQDSRTYLDCFWNSLANDPVIGIGKYKVMLLQAIETAKSNITNIILWPH